MIERTVRQMLVPVTTPTARRHLISARDRAVGVAAAVRENGRRMSPSFLVVGAQKAGTTFLHQELVRHPQVRAPLTKEIHFLDDRWRRGLPWYLGHFGLNDASYSITGESSPGYLFHPHAPERARRALPGVRAIVLLRDPVARAYSHHRHERRLGYEPEPSFARAVALEPLRTAAEMERIHRDPTHVSHAVRHFSYLARGRYAEQVSRWFDALGRERVKVVMSRDLFSDPRRVLHDVQEFLGIDTWQPDEIGRNDMANDGPPLDRMLERHLRSHFEESDEDLRRLLDCELGWSA